MYQSVADFHRAFGHPAPDVPGFAEQATRDLRIRLLLDEVEELEDADASDDLVEIAGEIVDVCYIACGTVVAYGLVGIHRPVVDEPSRVPRLAPRGPGRTAFVAGVGVVSSLLCDVDRRGALDDVADCAETLIEMCENLARLHGIPLRACFDEIHRANMLKLGPDGRPLLRADGKVVKPDGWTKADIRGVLVAHGWDGAS